MAAITAPVVEGGLRRFHWRIQFFSSLHMLLASVDLGLLSSVLTQVVPQWGLTPWDVGIIGIVGAIGTGLGAIVAGNAVDRFGRRGVLRLCLLTTGLGTVLSAASWDYLSLAAFQFILGLGGGGIAPAVAILVGEFTPARYRGRLNALSELYWVVGWLIAIGAAYIIIPGWGWRAAFAFGGISLIYVAIQSKLFPESPRFLLSKGRQREANSLLETLRARHGIVLDLSGATAARRGQSVWTDLRELWSGPLARRTACTWLLWFVLVFTYFGIFMWTPTLLSTTGYGAIRSFEFAFAYTLVQIPAVILAVFLVDWVGRKWPLVASLALCGVSSILFGRATEYSDLLVWGSLASVGNIIGWAIMLGYTAELFPTRLRGTGSGSASAFGRLGALTVPGAMALLLGSWTSGHQAVFFMFAAILLAGAFALAVLGEETKGRTLEEISSRSQ